MEIWEPKNGNSQRFDRALVVSGICYGGMGKNCFETCTSDTPMNYRCLLARFETYSQIREALYKTLKWSINTGPRERGVVVCWFFDWNILFLTTRQNWKDLIPEPVPVRHVIWHVHWSIFPIDSSNSMIAYWIRTVRSHWNYFSGPASSKVVLMP